jgi:hypothetical protein
MWSPERSLHGDRMGHQGCQKVDAPTPSPNCRQAQLYATLVTEPLWNEQ